uniref:Cadherin domain-containing protein n=1 Tax=Globodera rostochiensis TaxID=31243 RepID=A0A914HUE8_GLORO
MLALGNCQQIRIAIVVVVVVVVVIISRCFCSFFANHFEISSTKKWTYSIVTMSAPPFSIDYESGEVALRHRATLKSAVLSLAREFSPEDDKFLLEISATDEDGLSGHCNVSIKVKDVNRPPRIVPHQFLIRIDENAPIGAPVVKMEATDEDRGDNARLKFAISKEFGTPKIYYYQQFVQTLFAFCFLPFMTHRAVFPEKFFGEGQAKKMDYLAKNAVAHLLGTFIKNLDASKLNFGIWQGDVKLNSLEIKETALDELDLQVKLSFGHVQNLVFKIPWKNLYVEPTVVEISGVYLIIVPNQGIVYNDEKARKNEQEIKQRKLLRLEENRRNRQKSNHITEKPWLNIVKNLQVHIKRVHVRYEDKFSNRERPFSTGITLDSLNFQTTDENFKPIVQRETVKIFYKLISMSSLSIYSNANSTLISDLNNKKTIIDALRWTIAVETKPNGYNYVLEPLTIAAQLKLNQKPESDGSNWTTPKIDLSMELDKLGLSISKHQYQDMLLFLEAQERFTLAEKYLKYRPNLTQYREHYREWWNFAYHCILNEQVKRRRNNWSWDHMKAHRQLTPGKAMKEKIEEAEDALDVFNLNIARQQAEFVIDKHHNLVRVEDQKQEGLVDRVINWLYEEAAAPEDAQLFEEKELTPEEKQLLFDAIDYQENMPPTDYPKHFVENMFTLNLKMLMLKLGDVIEMRFSQLSSKLEQRSSANAMRFTSTVKSLEMHSGTESMLHMTETERDWLTMEFETNALDGSFDHRVSLDVAPVMFKYHAPAVNRALDVFKPPKSVRLYQLTTLAYEDVKARSVAALQHMVDESKKLKLEVKIDPVIFVVSAGGAFDPTKMTLIAELGKLQLNTLDEPSTKAYEHITEQKLRSLVAKAYDNFQLCLSDLRLIFSDSFDNCMNARQDRTSADHLLKPTGMCIDMLRATIDDVQIPRFRLIGKLPDIVFTISDDRLVELIEFFNSIPRPDFDEEGVDLSAPVADKTTLRDRAKMQRILAIGIVVKHRDCAFLSARIQQLSFHMCKRMFDMEVSAHMGAVAVRASPAAVGLLSRINAKLVEHQQNKAKQQAETNDRPMMRDYPNYWIPKQIERPEYWWFRPLKSTGGMDAINFSEDARKAAEMKHMTERAEFSIRRCLITVEAGRDVLRPMILIESSIAGTARNWSSSLTAKCEASLLVSYYNEAFNVWEPVIEPVLHEGRGWQNWKLAVKIGPQEDEAGQPSKIPSTSKQKNDESGGDAKKRALPPPKLAVVIEAAETLNITITKSFLQQLAQLADAFENAAKHISTPRRQLPGTSSHLLRNDTGLDISVSSTTSIKVVSSANAGRVQCAGGLYILMECVDSAASSLKTNWRIEEDQRQIQLQLAFAGTERTVNIARTEKQCVDLPWKASSGRKQSFVVETTNEDARHVVTLKSVVTVLNHLEMPVEIQALYNSKCLPCGIAQSKAIEPFNIPVPCLNTPNGLLQIRPANGQHDWSKENFSWLNFNTTKRQAVRCDNTVTGKGIFIEIVVVDEPIRQSHHRFDANSVAFTVHLFAPIHFINTLPMPVKISVPIKCELAGGEAVDIMNVVAGCPLIFAIEIGVEQYELCYTLPTVKKSLESVRLKGKSNTNAKLYLGLNWSTEFLRTSLALYAPYWMVNETGKQLAYKRIQGRCQCCSKCLRSRNHVQCEAAEILHPSDENPLILPLHKREFESKSRAKVKIVGVTDWSPSFPLDVAGNSGSRICKANVRGKRKREFEMSVDVQLCQSGLTKVVTISPFFLLKNDSNVDIEVREPHTLKWLLVAADSVIGFWPMQKGRRKTLVARYSNTKEESVQFPFTEAFEGFCQIKNNLIGLYVTVSLSDESSVVHMESFVPGMVPAILMNDTAHPIHYRQACDSHWNQIKPNQLAPFAWSDSMNDCKLEWKSGDAANSEDLLRNRDIIYLPSKNNLARHYCVSFLDGRQRILLFTADGNVSFSAHQEYAMEQANIDMELHLHGVGISVVNNHKSLELLYMAISPQRPQKLKKGAKLSTTMNTGFWCKYLQTAHMQTLHVKLQHFQVDNQLPASTFRSMLAMVPQPKSVVKNEPKPFLECSFVMSQSEHTNIVQIKLLEALVQEFAIRLDRTLINELLDIMPKEHIQTRYTRDSFHKDMELTKETLGKRAIQTRVSQAKTYYQRMHISPLMIHLSFSQGHVEEGTDGVGIQWEFANLIFKSVGVTLTEIQDVTFKLAFFQREACFYNRAQLQSEVRAHYMCQLLQQFYVLVFGLDILGNPFRLVRDLRTGAVDLFYQPVLGMVTGPAEFGEGVYIGLTSAFRHTVCGVLGVTSRITGTAGKAVAALTMDQDYQRRRMLTHQSTSIGTGMFRGLRGVGTGVVEGVTGVLSKPVEGVKQGGLLGGIKGIGTGMVGVVARPVSGVVDLVTTLADNVRNAISNKDIQQIRPPRVIFRDKIIRPYIWEEAVGFEIFRETECGQTDADHFLTYGAITQQLVIIVTDKHVIKSRKNILTEEWSADWRLRYSELERPVRVNTGGKFGIELRLKKKEKEGFSLFSKGAGANGKLVQFSAEYVAQRVFVHILRAWESGAVE